MGDIEFLLNGAPVRVTGTAPTETVLDWLRGRRGLTGTKEGCNEGDCGACTVLVSEMTEAGIVHRALNACILFVPQLHGRALRTIEGIAAPDGRLHPVQEAMVAEHGSQCGFCTPGIVVSLAAGHLAGRRDHDDVLAGNLCRCTGYAPIVRAAEAASRAPVPGWMRADEAVLKAAARAREDARIGKGGLGTRVADAYLPASVDDLASWYAANPDALLVGGGTDVGLWVTKGLRSLPRLCFVAGVPGLSEVLLSDAAIRIGAGVTLSELGELMSDHHPDFAELIRRFGSVQVRNAATLGGNIANGSPIGDAAPALIALGARLHLRLGQRRRQMALEDFFLDYGRQDRAPGEFVEAVSIPIQADHLKCYKVSKRFDQDISALCGAFSITVAEGRVTAARIAFGGMAATPRRARAVEQALLGQAWDEAAIRSARARFAEDFQPIDDMRASAEYRLAAAANLLTRYFAESRLGRGLTRVLEVRP
jgi:xanthine dehydrogenase small subunit